MKKHLFTFLAAAAAFALAAENFFPNGTFEGDWRPVWNRMNTESYLLEMPGWELIRSKSGNFLQSGTEGKALELQFEGHSYTGTLSLDLKGAKKGQTVTLTLNTYQKFLPLVLLKKNLDRF